MRAFDFNSAIVRAPGKSVVNGLRADAGPSPEYSLVVAEHAAYIAALRAAGVEVTVLDALEQFPDSMFVEDPALVFSQAAVLLRPGAPSRMAEAGELAATLAVRFPEVLQLGEGNVDGGDILVTAGGVLISLSARTNPAGAAALQPLLRSIGLSSKVIAISHGALHLKTDCSLIDEETVLATEELANSRIFDGLRILVVPRAERQAANALRVNDAVFVKSDCLRTQEMLSRHGVSVVPVPASEIAKLDAGLSCMSLRWFDHGIATLSRRARQNAFPT